MKHIFKLYFILSLIFVHSNVYSTQWSVSNDPLRPAQFTSAQSAINAAANGDTIIIAGSTDSYGNINVNKTLVLIGEGFNNPDGQNTIFTNIFLLRLNSTQSASGTKILGINISNILELDPAFTGSTIQNRVISNILIQSCRIYVTNIRGAGVQNSFTDIMLHNCLLSAQLSFVSIPILQNFKVENSIFSGSASGMEGNGGNQVFVRNCLFLNKTTDLFFSACSNMVFENNIFYKAEPTGASNSVFNNNLSYLCNNNTLPPAIGSGNTGTGNIQNSNPLFINYPALGADFAWTHNYGLQVGSPAIGAGTGGTNIGLTGGTYPLNQLKGNSPLPVVTSLSLPNSSVPVSGTLQGNIQAKVRN